MNVDDSDFITNIANTLATDIINKMKKAQEYFREDPDCVGKCIIMQHLAICTIIMDYIAVLDGASPLTPHQIFGLLEEDTMLLIRKYKERHDNTI